MTFLLPRLGPLGVERVLGPLGVPAAFWRRLREVPEEVLQFVSFAASGGSRNDDAAFVIGDRLREIARTKGFPDSLDRQKQAAFDLDASAYLAQEPLLRGPEALRDDVWAFLTCVSAPDVVAWRFSDRHPKRFNGGVRNTFQRLWIRGVTLDRGAGHHDRWGLVRALTEDAMVQIFERSAIYGHRALAKAIAEAWVEEAAEGGRESMEPVMRRAIKVVRLTNEILDIAHLSSDELSRALKPVFRVARAGGEDVSAPEAPEGDPPGLGSSVVETQPSRDALSLERLGRLNGLLSPNSRAALTKIRSGQVGLDTTQRHALDYLLKQLSEKGVDVARYTYLTGQP